MNLVRYALAIGIVVGAMSSDSSAQSGSETTTARPHEKLDGIRRILDDIVERQKLVGLQATVYSKGRVVAEEYRGFADLEHEVPVSAKSRFPIASINKAFTGCALLRLAEDGKIDLDAPIQSYVPEFPQKPEGAITARMLSHCLSGIRHYRDDERDRNWYGQHFETAREGIVLFKDDPLVAVPGKAFGYSSYGYNLLAAAIESATGRRFDEYVTESICKPLGMAHTEFENVQRVMPGRVRLYSWHNLINDDESDELYRVPTQEHSYNMGGGNLLSTSADLVRFGRAFIKPGFVSSKILKQIATPGKTTAGTSVPFSYGWMNNLGSARRRRLLIGGSFPGVQATLDVYPEDDLVVALLTNTWGKGFRNKEFIVGVSKRIADILLE